MKIVLAHKYFFRGGGTATYLFALREQLHKMGHETIPFTVAFDQTVPDEYSEFYVSPPAGSDQTHLKDMKMTPLLALKLLGRATWSVEAYYKARALVEATKPDIAYVHNLYNYMSPSPIAAFKDMGVPVVMRVSDYNMICPGLKVLRNGKPCFECIQHGYAHALRYRCHKDSLAATAARVLSMYLHQLSDVYAKVDLFIAPSKFLRELLVEAGLDRARVAHIPSFYPGRNGLADGPTTQRHILYFGRLSPVKGLETLLTAYSYLRDPPPLVIAGADTAGYSRHLQSVAASLNTESVDFVGLQDIEDLGRLIDESLFTVVPSEWPDNFPMSVLESFAREKAVVGARIGGIPEQVTDDCGLLFEPGDVTDLAKKMDRLIRDSDLRQRMGQRGYKRLSELYSPNGHCTELISRFDRLVTWGPRQ